MTILTSLATRNLTTLPPYSEKTGALARQQQRFILLIYLSVCLMAIAFYGVSGSAQLQAFAVGLFAPGAGFYYWADTGALSSFYVLLGVVVSVWAFTVSLIIWFGTGNIVFPVAVWLVTAIMVGSLGMALDKGYSEHANPGTIYTVMAVVVTFLFIACGWSQYLQSIGRLQRQRSNERLASAEFVSRRAKNRTGALSTKEELSEKDIQLLRLVLDRALQPIDEFNGFEHIDQFQTSALRYQLNFMSYALSLAQSVHLPAFAGYLHEAQKNLAEKQKDPAIWRYWQLENLWGNLRLDADPIRQDNIMFTGFVSAQLAYFQNSSGIRPFDQAGSFVCEHPSGKRYVYSLPRMIEGLVSQYKSAKMGLLPCEPNWIYPLCNFITVSAIRASDTVNGTEHWRAIEWQFRARLETEFIRPNGGFVPFYSAYTGWAAPAIGGVVMQTFPCLYLNSVLPDIAERQWELFRTRFDAQRIKKDFWAIDVGNYRFSRASSYVGAAAAAVEMGDRPLAKLLLQKLDQEVPQITQDGICHRPMASLWAHAVELIARFGSTNGLSDLVHHPQKPRRDAPFIAEAAYPEILVAKAVNDGAALKAVLYPGTDGGEVSLSLGGLRPDQNYRIEANEVLAVRADHSGHARCELSLTGRTPLLLFPET